MKTRAFACTVHVGTDSFWPRVQPGFIRRHVPDVTIVAAIDDDVNGRPDFDHAEVMGGEHKDKLDSLGRLVVDELGRDDDLLIFLDGDAFPIRAVGPFAADVLSKVPLAAVCRREMPGQDFPHPSFCMTTVRFWNELGGTWELSSGREGRMNDMGCRLLELLEESEVAWRPLLRSNAFNPHPVLFGLYGGLVYHQGAGFRRPVTALDRQLWRDRAPKETWTSPDRYRFFFDVVGGQNQMLSDLFKRLIVQSPDFYELLEEPAPDR